MLDINKSYVLRARPLNAFPFTSPIAIPKSRRRIIIYIYISLSKNPMPRDEITSIRFFSSSSYVSGVTHTPTLSACLVLVRITCRKIHTHILFPPTISTILLPNFHLHFVPSLDTRKIRRYSAQFVNEQPLLETTTLLVVSTQQPVCNEVSGKGKVSISKSRARMES